MQVRFSNRGLKTSSLNEEFFKEPSQTVDMSIKQDALVHEASHSEYELAVFLVCRVVRSCKVVHVFEQGVKLLEDLQGMVKGVRDHVRERATLLHENMRSLMVSSKVGRFGNHKRSVRICLRLVPSQELAEQRSFPK